MMKVGVRYCGGCNPRYDRGMAVKSFKEKHVELDVRTAAEGEEYDLLLVVGGCSACCASYEQFAAEKIVKLWTAEAFEEI